VNSSQPRETARQVRAIAQFRRAVPSRALGHALVIALSIGVAYAGHSSSFTSEFRLGSIGGNLVRPSAYAYPNGVLSQDTLIREPVAPAPPPDRSQILRYVAKPGDTVASLSDRFNVSANTIIWSNSLADGQTLQPGQVLLIPPVSGLIYAVQPGDTIDSIAQEFQSDSESILQFNTIADPKHPAAGTTLVVPGGRLLAQARANLSDRSGVRPSDRPADSLVISSPAPLPAQSVTGSLVSDIPRFIPFADRFMSRETPGETQTLPPPQPLKPIVYRVVDGDTLSGIAAKFGISADNLAASNGLQGSADSLSIDQKILIPPVPGVLHLVSAGDTLEAVAQVYSAKPDEIAKANGLSDPFVLQVGQILIVPNGQAPALSAPTPAPQPATTYTVQDGDSVSSIADAFGVDPQTVIDANSLSDPYLLQPGQKVVIPGASAAHTTSAAAASPAPAAQPAVVAPAPTPRPAPRPVIVARPAPVVHAAAPAPRTSSGWSIVAIASRYLGIPYVWGGTSPGGFDCSGLVWYVYQRAGMGVPRDLYGQLQSGTRVARSNLLPGDIVFFSNTYEAGLSHDGIYIGGGRFINAVDYGIGVAVSSLNDSYWSAHYYGASRPW